MRRLSLVAQSMLMRSVLFSASGMALALVLGQPWSVAITLGVTLLTATWWVTEVVPIGVASLLPLTLLPLFGVLDSKTAASVLGHPVILLLIGAFMMAKALGKSGVDKRIALTIIGKFGHDKPKGILLGLMLTSAFLSMWMSNVATVLMLMPIVLGIAAGSRDRHFTTILLLGVAFAASVGGLGTPVGTPANVVFSSVYTSYFGVEFGFLDWMSIGLPIVVVAVPLMAIWLGRSLTESINVSLPKVGTWRAAERRVLTVFGFVIVAWVFRTGPYGGWTSLAPWLKADDGTVAIMGAILMFIIPSGEHDVGSKDLKSTSPNRLLDWETAIKIPWSVIFLLAGGICLAKGFKASGLSELLGTIFSGLSHLPLVVTIATICLLVTFLTEITSNTATTALLMPVLASAAIAMNIDAKLLMIPAAMSASCAFMLPAATAPNAVVYGANYFSIKHMAREGFVLNLLLAGLITAVSVLLIQ